MEGETWIWDDVNDQICRVTDSAMQNGMQSPRSETSPPALSSYRWGDRPDSLSSSQEALCARVRVKTRYLHLEECLAVS